MTGRRPGAGRASRGRAIIGGLAAAAGLLALTAGPPVLLALAYGTGDYPLPPEGLSLTGRLTDTALVDLLAGAVLLTWLRWLACLLFETAAAIRRRGLPRPVPLVSGIEQLLARRLITAALGLLVSTASAAPALAAGPPPGPPVAAAPAVPGPAPHRASGPAAAPGGTPAARRADGPTHLPSLPRYIVQPLRNGHSESLWSIAERYLGDGRRWTEIYALNKDRTQADGEHLHLARLIRPGWELLLPADAEGLPTQPRTGADVPGEVTIEPGDTLSAIAARTMGDPSRWPEIFHRNAGSIQPDGTRLENPDRILPGMRLRIPAPSPSRAGGPGARARPHTPANAAPHGHPTPRHTHPPAAPPPTTRQDAPLPTPHATATPPSPANTPRPTAPPAAAQRVAGHRHSSQPAPAWITTGALLATSLAGVVTYRRRRRDSRTRTGQKPPTPDRKLVKLHTSVLAAQNAATVDRLETALRILAALTLDRPDTEHSLVPQLVLRHPDGGIDVFLAEPLATAPAPWIVSGGGRVWTVPAKVPLAASELPPPCPALVQLGVTEDGAELYADLEALGVLAIDAEAAELRGIARAVTATLSLSPFAELVRVRTTGFDPYGLTSEERLIAEDNLDELLEHTAADASHITHALTETPAPGTFTLRARDTDENWDPTVAVLAGQPPSGAIAVRLAELAGTGGKGVAVVAAASPDLPARWHLALADADADGDGSGPRWRLDPVGITLIPLQLAAAELADLTGLLAEAAAPAEDLISQPPADVTPPAATDAKPPTPGPNAIEAGAARGPAVGDDWMVMVRLLGPIDVIRRDGYRPEAVRDHTLQILAWLVTHRPHGTRPTMEAAIWPTGAHPGTVTNELGRARRLLEDLAGKDTHNWIRPRPLTLHPAVVSDLDLIRTHTAHADSHPDDAARALEAALDLVRGVPTHYHWLDAELGSTLTTLPVRAAIHLAELHLQHGDTDAVLAVTARGLTLIPAHTELFALRMRAVAAAGDLAAVKAEYEAYRRAEKADPFYDNETEPDLQRLYQQLLRQRRHAG